MISLVQRCAFRGGLNGNVNGVNGNIIENQIH